MADDRQYITHVKLPDDSVYYFRDADAVYTNTEQVINDHKIFTTRPSLQSNFRIQPDYTAVDYMHFDGNVWIDTGLKVHMNYKYVITYKKDNTTGYRIWGEFNQQSYNGGFNTSLTYATYDAIRWTVSGSTTELVTFGFPFDTNKHNVIIDNGNVTVDGTDLGRSTGHSSTAVSNYNAFLGTINPGGTAPSTSLVGNIYNYEVYDNDGVLIQKLIPCIRNADNTLGFYDTVNAQFYTKSGTGSFARGPISTSEVILSNYQEVEYIETTGTQFIDTGINANGTIKAEADFMMMAIPSTYWSFAGARNGASNRAYIFGTGNQSGLWGCGYIGNLTDSTTPIFPEIKYHAIQTLDNGSQTLIVNDYPVYNYTTTGTLAANTTIYIGGLHYYGSSNVLVASRIYGFKLWIDGDLKRDFVPCVRISDQVVGLYDNVSKTFFTNGGTGSFTKGPNTSGWGDFTIFSDFASVAFSGDYNDLLNRPDLTNYVTTTALNTALANYVTLDTDQTIDGEKTFEEEPIITWFDGSTDYQSIDYVIFGGTHYVQPDITLTEDSTYSLDLDFAALGSNAYGLIGNYNQAQYLVKNTVTTNIQWYNSASNTQTYSPGFATNTRYLIELKNSKLYLDNTVLGTLTINSFSASPIMVGNRYDSNRSVTNGLNGKMYGFTIDNHIYKPVFRRSDNIVGFLDLLDGTFYPLKLFSDDSNVTYTVNVTGGSTNTNPLKIQSTISEYVDLHTPQETLKTVTARGNITDGNINIGGIRSDSNSTAYINFSSTTSDYTVKSAFITTYNGGFIMGANGQSLYFMMNDAFRPTTNANGATLSLGNSSRGWNYLYLNDHTSITSSASANYYNFFQGTYGYKLPAKNGTVALTSDIGASTLSLTLIADSTATTTFSANASSNASFTVDLTPYAKTTALPSVYDASLTLTLIADSTSTTTFTANASSNKSFTVDLSGYAKTSALPTVYDGTLSLLINGATATTFSANSSANATFDVTIPAADAHASITLSLIEASGIFTGTFGSSYEIIRDATFYSQFSGSVPYLDIYVIDDSDPSTTYTFLVQTMRGVQVETQYRYTDVAAGTWSLLTMEFVPDKLSFIVDTDGSGACGTIYSNAGGKSIVAFDGTYNNMIPTPNTLSLVDQDLAVYTNKPDVIILNGNEYIFAGYNSSYVEYISAQPAIISGSIISAGEIEQLFIASDNTTLFITGYVDATTINTLLSLKQNLLTTSIASGTADTVIGFNSSASNATLVRDKLPQVRRFI